tara:strand:- start:38 stop:280 length:243 start_codon:yes stop_codon:yes gene_type:complete
VDIKAIFLLPFGHALYSYFYSSFISAHISAHQALLAAEFSILATQQRRMLNTIKNDHKYKRILYALPQTTPTRRNILLYC